MVAFLFRYIVCVNLSTKWYIVCGWSSLPEATGHFQWNFGQKRGIFQWCFPEVERLGVAGRQLKAHRFSSKNTGSWWESCLLGQVTCNPPPIVRSNWQVCRNYRKLYTTARDGLQPTWVEIISSKLWIKARPDNTWEWSSSAAYKHVWIAHKRMGWEFSLLKAVWWSAKMLATMVFPQKTNQEIV